MPPRQSKPPRKIPCDCGCGGNYHPKTVQRHRNLKTVRHLGKNILTEMDLIDPQELSFLDEGTSSKRKRPMSTATGDESRQARKRRKAIAPPSPSPSHHSLPPQASFEDDPFVPIDHASNSLAIPESELESAVNPILNEQYSWNEGVDSSPRDNIVSHAREFTQEQRIRLKETRWHANFQVEDSESDEAIDEEDFDEEDSEDEDEGEHDCNLEDMDLADFPLANVSTYDGPSEEFYRAMASINGQSFREEDLSTLRMYALKTEGPLTEAVFDKVQMACPSIHHLSLKKTKRRVAFMSGLEPERYDCCVNSCVCFTGAYEGCDECPNCNEPRWTEGGKVRKYFEYLPIIPRLRGMMGNVEFARALRYRAEHKHEPGVITDVFDGSHYRSLLEEFVTVDGTTLDFFHFSDERDIALGFSTDGFAVFKNRPQTSWPIIMFIYNLAPDIRFRKGKELRLGIIPGPKKPWDWDSFMLPCALEMIRLAIGVPAFDSLTQSLFDMHAYVILGFGDILAMALVMRMKGPNAIFPCRLCEIEGIRTVGCRVHYVPLHRDNILESNSQSYDPFDLPLRTHDNFMQQAAEVQVAPTKAAAEKLSKRCGIKGVPLLSCLSSLSFPWSFPFDFMHLIWENLIPNLIAFWTGEFKQLDCEGDDYVIDRSVWDAIGEASYQAGKTIPSAFGTRVPNLATRPGKVTAEMRSVWTLYLAPILLEHAFTDEVYYAHFIELVRLLNLCLQFEISDEELDEIDNGFKSWVIKYEALYYQHDPARLSACPLTIHALLHIGDGIRAMGPVWAYWAFPIERQCNDLLSAVVSRRNPYVSISNYMTATAHLSQIKLMYNLEQEISLERPKKMDDKFTTTAYPGLILSGPRRNGPLSPEIHRKIVAHLVTRYDSTMKIVRQAFTNDATIIQYGRLAIDGGGDSIQARDLVTMYDGNRDASYVRYVLQVDKYAHQRRRQPVFVWRDFYGQLLRIFVVQLPRSKQLKLAAPTTHLLALIQQIEVQETNPIGIPMCKDVPNAVQEVVDLSTVKCLVGRVRRGNLWAIVDRGGGGTKTNQLMDE